MDLAIFDFDGTITTKGTYPGFMRFAVRPARQLLGAIVLSPLIVGYKCRLVSDHRIRTALSRVGFWREDPERVRLLGTRYAEDVLSGMIRPAALERIAWHKSRGDRVLVVSASLDVYLEPWCRSAGTDVICTRLETKDGRLTGRYVHGDCCGSEKAKRIRDRYSLGEYATVYAYGDTEEDREMLEIAHRKYFRWEEVQEVPRATAATRRGDGGV
jgi:phosphatidylglycerophosphatase C